MLAYIDDRNIQSLINIIEPFVYRSISTNSVEATMLRPMFAANIIEPLYIIQLVLTVLKQPC